MTMRDEGMAEGRARPQAKKVSPARNAIAAVLLIALSAVVILGCAGLVTPTNRGSFTVTVVGKSGAAKSTVEINLNLQ